MKKYNPIYYFLFVLLMMGGFASMAQNDYGVRIMGFVAVSFSILFLIQLFQVWKEKSERRSAIITELISLSVLALILAMRVFYIRFQFIEIVFGAAGITLMVLYVLKSVYLWKTREERGTMLTNLVLLFYSSIIFYTMSMVMVPFFPALAEPSGGLGFILLIGFLFISITKRDILVGGEKTHGIKYVTKFKDNSVVLLMIFLMFTAYMGLTKVGVLPKMYSDEFPQAYFELVDKAESGIEKPKDGKYKHDEFKEKYDQLVERHTN